MSNPTIPVTLRALFQRINSKLATQDKALKTARFAPALAQVGRYYVVNRRCDQVTQTHVDPVALAQELGVLAGWEVVVGEPCATREEESYAE